MSSARHQLSATPVELWGYGHLDCDLDKLFGVLVRVVSTKHELAAFGEPYPELGSGITAVTPFIGGRVRHRRRRRGSSQSRYGTNLTPHTRRHREVFIACHANDDKVATEASHRSGGRDADRSAAGGRRGSSSVEVVPQHLGPGGVTKLRHGFGLDLPDALAGDAVDLADLVQGTRLAVGEPEAQPYHAGLPLGQRL